MAGLAVDEYRSWHAEMDGLVQLPKQLRLPLQGGNTVIASSGDTDAHLIPFALHRSSLSETLVSESRESRLKDGASWLQAREADQSVVALLNSNREYL